MTDQPKPDRQNGDGLLRDEEAVREFFRHSFDTPTARDAFDRIMIIARATQPARDGAEGACPNCGSTAPDHSYACYRAPPKPAPDAMRAQFVRQELGGALVFTVLENENSIVEVTDCLNGTYALTVHSRDEERDRWDDLTATLRPEHFSKLGSVAAPGQRAIRNLPLLWECRANALRILDGERGLPDEGTLGEADGLAECAKELRTALSATDDSLNQQSVDHPPFDNPHDPFASPDRLPPDFSAPVPPASDDEMVDRETLIAKYRAIHSKEAQFIALCIEAWQPVPPADGASDVHAIVDQVLYQFENDGRTLYPDNEVIIAIERIRSALSSGAGSAEPVAWRWRYKATVQGLLPWMVCIEHPTGDVRALDIEPLYATPPVRGDREAIARAAYEADPDLQVWRTRGEANWSWDEVKAMGQDHALPFYNIADAILSLPVQPGAGEREALIEECAKIAEESLVGHTLTPGGLARQDEAETIASRIRALSRQAPPSSSDGGR